LGFVSSAWRRPALATESQGRQLFLLCALLRLATSSDVFGEQDTFATSIEVGDIEVSASLIAGSTRVAFLRRYFLTSSTSFTKSSPEPIFDLQNYGGLVLTLLF
jgi:hypothetical protein